jgi:MerR family mercuric resistance operon transcriptional regulator
MVFSEVDMETVTIGQLARKAQVHVETVRYYERRGLLPPPARRWSGYRQYSHDDIIRLRFIKHAQRLGFSLKEIAELLSLRVDPDTSCRDVKHRAEAKLVDIEEKIRTLERIKNALKQLVAACRGRGPTTMCPILEALETREEA